MTVKELIDEKYQGGMEKILNLVLINHPNKYEIMKDIDILEYNIIENVSYDGNRNLKLIIDLRNYNIGYVWDDFEYFFIEYDELFSYVDKNGTRAMLGSIPKQMIDLQNILIPFIRNDKIDNILDDK